ncbi:MAG TPA: hypothetical protein VKZ70_03050 [Burkholderiaceae bacterium]|nr:hypothetical protein [Burkholderiaceae bacterium]
MQAAQFDHAAALIACAKGDQAAFHRLYDHEAPHMLALCRQLLPGDPEGLLHDALTLIWRNADQYDVSMGPARPWIYSVLRHVANGRRMRSNTVPTLQAPTLPNALALRGKVAALAQLEDPTAFQAVAHAYLHGADYSRLAVWLKRDEAQLREAVRSGLHEVSL